MIDNKDLTIAIPARNESTSIAKLLDNIHETVPNAQILVINDASEDDTAEIARNHGAEVISHIYQMGNGAAIKTALRNTQTEYIVFMDADGQHAPADIPRLLAKLEEGYELVVGARSSDSHANLPRKIANFCYNRLASWMVKHPILDLTSGFRATRTSTFRQFLFLIPNGFSYPTSTTMACFRMAYPVAYVPIIAAQRNKETSSHINPLRDGLRFFIIIFRIGALFSPLRIFAPVSFSFALMALINYSYTYLSTGRLTNMTAITASAAIVVFLIGLIGEQITYLLYRDQK